MIKDTINRTIARAGAVSLVTLLAHAVPVSAAGLGDIQVLSHLGQPLVAEAEIHSLQPKEFESLIVRIAPQEAFKTANVPFSNVVRQVRVEPTKRPNGTPILRFTTHQPVNEPMLVMLVDFNWPNGRLMQKYSILLDPAR
jgi:pilus assembly protein FimV